MSEARMPRSLNSNESLWSHLGGLPPDADAIRKYRRTACPVEGDDDVDDFEDDPSPDTPGEETPPSPPDGPGEDSPGDEQPT